MRNIKEGKEVVLTIMTILLLSLSLVISLKNISFWYISYVFLLSIIFLIIFYSIIHYFPMLWSQIKQKINIIFFILLNSALLTTLKLISFRYFHPVLLTFHFILFEIIIVESNLFIYRLIKSKKSI